MLQNIHERIFVISKRGAGFINRHQCIIFVSFVIKMENRPALIYADPVTPRLKYAVRLLLETVLRIPCGITSDREEFVRYEGPKICYAKEKCAEALHIVPSGLLAETGLRNFVPVADVIEGMPVLFPANDADSFFDVFSAAFYLVTRYEEYLPFRPDQHGRFPASESILFKKGWLNRPLVNEWAFWLAEKLKQVFPDFSFNGPVYQCIPTIDVDNAFAYCHKGFIRNTGGALLDVLLNRKPGLPERIASLTGKREDPFNTFDWIHQIHKNFQLSARWFFLGGRYGRYDKNIPLTHPSMQKIIQDCAANGSVGIHPSYHSSGSEKRMRQEKELAEAVLRKSVTMSRQHFLRIRFPDTFRNLMRIGIREDYSMGYSTHPGFRAGIASPFLFYDLLKEQTTELMMYPFAFMDRTFYSPDGQVAESAMEIIEKIIRSVFRVKGTLMFIFHNETFAGPGKEWKEFYQKILALATNLSDDQVSGS